ncbi:MAG: hypothetical protein M3N12_09655 [Verrucomicrobiota bacterium]|nr:hypothetical protein [Verrucomicrobiota bacterium]
MISRPKLLFLALSSLLVIQAHGGPLEEAHVTKIINDVRVFDPAKGPHHALLNELIKEELGLQTGIRIGHQQSRRQRYDR